MAHEEDLARADHASAEGALGKQADDNREKANTDTDLVATTTAAADNRKQADADQRVTVGLLEKMAKGLTASSDNLTAAVVARDAREDRHRRYFYVTAALSLATILLIGVIMIGYLRQQSVRDGRAAEQRAAIATTQRQLAECTIPTGRCYKEETRRKAAATAAAAACAQTNTGYPAIKACVDKTLAK